MESFLNDNWNEDTTKDTVNLLREQSKQDVEGKMDGAVLILEDVSKILFVILLFLKVLFICNDW